MKKSILLISITIVFFSCSTKFVELYKTGALSPNISIQKDSSYYLFENDTLKIAYYFWDKTGIVSFNIFNKLDRPIYIDWKKTNYIPNGNKLEYWNDIFISKSSSITYSTSTANSTSTASYRKNSLPIANIFGTSNTMTTTLTSREERITFIPPKTSLTMSRYNILSACKIDWNNNVEKVETIRNDNSNKKTIIYIKKYTPQNSPLVFRNFFTFSIKEDFASEFFVDNVFFIKEVNNMDIKNFVVEIPADPNDINSKIVYNEYYRNGISFYLDSKDATKKKEEQNDDN